jgi:hypothetical protein
MPPRSTFEWKDQDHFKRDSLGDARPTGSGVRLMVWFFEFAGLPTAAGSAAAEEVA